MRKTLLALCALAVSAGAGAHSASDAYLNIVSDKSPSAAAAASSAATVLHGQWDIALRDLEFVLKLNDRGDGKLTWGEVRRHQAEIEKYAYAHLHIAGVSGGACSIEPTRQMIDEHADGAYAALFFDVKCERSPEGFALNYDLFFSIDPSHRGILVMRSGNEVATALLSPQNAGITLNP
jgi:hypothetical protein